MTQQIYHFNINKFSIFQRNQNWYHFPQRSDLSISFVSGQSEEIAVTVYWRGATLVRKTTHILKSFTCS
ncbi:MAG: hypothetical protein M5F18_01510 [Asgard group archaeon]|nr:hypothetical protein [Asgard group archaeon]